MYPWQTRYPGLPGHCINTDAVTAIVTVLGEIFEQVLFLYNSNNQRSKENETYSKISRVIERIDQASDQVISRSWTC